MKLSALSRQLSALTLFFGAVAGLSILASAAQAAYVPGLANNGPGYGGEPYSSMIALGPSLASSWTMGDPAGSTTASDPVSGNTLTKQHGTVTFGGAGLVPYDRFSSAAFSSSGCLAASSSSVLSFDKTQPFWISAVISGALPTSGGEWSFLTKSLNSGSFAGFDWEDYNGYPAIWLITPGGFPQTGGPTQPGTGTHQLAVEWDGSGAMSFLLDGVYTKNTLTPASGTMINSGVLSMAARDCGQADAALYLAASFGHVAIGLGTGMVTTPGYTSYAQNFYSTGQYMNFLGRQLPPLYRGVPNVILDNDGADDIDNYADVRMFGALALAGKINPIAYIASDGDPNNVSAAHVGLTYLGVTVGEYGCNKSLGSPGGYTAAVVAQFNAGDSCSNYDSDIVGYCKALHNAADQSVTIVMGGGARSLDLVMNQGAPACVSDSRSGKDLVCAKVTQVVWVAGSPPTLAGGDYNLSLDASSAQDLIDNWVSNCPRVQFTFWGIDQTDNQSPQPSTGPFPSTTCSTSSTDPFQLAFYTFVGGSINPCMREAWSQSALYYVANGAGANFGAAGVLGSASFTAGSGGSWTTSAGPFNYLYAKIGGSAMQSIVCTTERFGSTNWC